MADDARPAPPNPAQPRKPPAEPPAPAMSDLHGEFDRLRRELLAELGFSFHDLTQRVAALGRPQPDDDPPHAPPPAAAPVAAFPASAGVDGSEAAGQGVSGRVHRFIRRARALLASGERLDSLSERLALLPDRLGIVDLRLARFGERLDRGDARDAEQRQALRDAAAAIERRLDALDAEVEHRLARANEAATAEIAGRFDRLRAELGGEIARIGGEIGRIASEQSEAKSRLIQLPTGSDAPLDQVRADLARLADELREARRQAAELQAHIEAQLDRLRTSLVGEISRLADDQLEALNQVTQVQTGTESRLDQLRAELGGELSRLANEQFETKNQVTHLQTSTGTRLNAIENVRLEALGEQLHEIIAAQFDLLARSRPQAPQDASPAERYAPAAPLGFDACMERAQAEFASAYPPWRERLDALPAVFRDAKLGNAANGLDVYSKLFRGFCETYATGRVLDVGCGVFGRPYYLTGYPAELVSGIDPLPPFEPADFELVRGISEFLPWPDDAFSTVVSATSLDHCLSLDRSLAEMRRVLRPGGRLLLWIGAVPGAPAYDPDAPGFAPIDAFHLFHFDIEWFEPMLEREFRILDRLRLERSSFSHLMYCLAEKPGPDAR